MLNDPECFWTRQYDSPGNWLAYARLADLLVRAMGRIDCLVGCIGTGGSLCGTGTFLRMIFPDLRIFAVDTHRSILFGQPVGKRMLRGLGNSVLPANVRHELIDEIHWVGAYPAYMTAHRLLREHGMFMGATSGAAALVAQWVAKTHPDKQVVAIMPDEGHRHSETVYNEKWLATLPGWPCQERTEPKVVDRIEPYPESEWTRFSWQRRCLDDVLHAQSGDR